MYLPATRAAGAVTAAIMLSALLSGVRSSSGYSAVSSGATTACRPGSADALVWWKNPVARLVATMPGWMATALSWPYAQRELGAGAPLRGVAASKRRCHSAAVLVLASLLSA
jgi:hypothetical protein